MREGGLRPKGLGCPENAHHGPEVMVELMARILVIDDNASVRDVLRDLLVVTAEANGADLVNAAQRDAWIAWGHEVDRDGVVDALQALNVGIERFTTGIQPNIKMALEQTLIEIGGALAGTGQRATL